MVKRIKEGYKKFKEVWNDPKKHDFAVLGLWLVFIVILIVIARLSTQVHEINQNTNVTETKTTEIRSYEFTYEYEGMQINGMTYEDKMLYYQNNKKYYVKNNIYQINGDIITIDPTAQLKTLKISYKMLETLIENITPINNIEYQTYLIPLAKFIKEYENVNILDLSSVMNYNIVVNINKKDGYIKKASLDLSNYYKYRAVNIDYPVAIYYYNINKVSDFSEEYDSMLGVN